MESWRCVFSQNPARRRARLRVARAYIVIRLSLRSAHRPVSPRPLQLPAIHRPNTTPAPLHAPFLHAPPPPPAISSRHTHTLHTDPSCTTHTAQNSSQTLFTATSSILEVVGEVLRKIGFLIVMEARLPPVDHRLTEHILDPRTANSRAGRRRSRHASGRVARVAINLLELDRLQVESVDLRGCTRHRWRRRLLGRRLGCGSCTGGGLGGQ